MIMVVFMSIVSFITGAIVGYNLKAIFNQNVEAYVKKELNNKKKTTNN